MNRATPNAKTPKSNEEANGSGDDVAVVAPNEEANGNDNAAVVDAVAVAAADAQPNEEQPADILKLDIDCFEETFDYSRLTDLISAGKTCKRLQQVAGYCLNLKYPDISFWCTSQGFEYKRIINVSHLSAFIRKIRIDSDEGLRFLLNNQSKLRRLKHITLDSLIIIQNDIDRMKETISKVEELRIENCVLHFDQIIAHCPKLRRLQVERCTTDLNWLVQECPTLEYFKFFPHNYKVGTNERIAMFLQSNPNIREFEPTSEYLSTMKNANGIKFENLAILIDSLPSEIKTEFPSFCNFLNELHERGFYKRLQLCIPRVTNQQMIDQMATIHGLDKVSAMVLTPDVTLSPLKNIVELLIRNCLRIQDMESLAKELVNLKQIHFVAAYLYDITPFIKRSVEMERIRVNFLCGLNANIVDLPALNELREQLPHPRKTTLYVDEKVYLATKWALAETNFPLIRLKRLESREWKHDASRDF